MPVPKIADIAGLARLNEKLAAADQSENAHHIDHRATTIGQDFTLEAPLLAALPIDEFDITLTTTPRVDPLRADHRAPSAGRPVGPQAGHADLRRAAADHRVGGRGGS